MSGTHTVLVGLFRGGDGPAGSVRTEPCPRGRGIRRRRQHGAGRSGAGLGAPARRVNATLWSSIMGCEPHRPTRPDHRRTPCERLGIAGRILRLSDLTPGPALAERARIMRYQVLANACAEAGILHLLLGHHAADQVETLAMRVLGGSQTHGLAGMPALARNRRGPAAPAAAGLRAVATAASSDRARHRLGRGSVEPGLTRAATQVAARARVRASGDMRSSRGAIGRRRLRRREEEDDRRPNWPNA